MDVARRVVQGGDIARPEQAIIWELRGAWARHKPVRLVLTDRCLVKVVMGQIRRIAVTGAFVEIDGWHVPAGDILTVGFPLLEELEAYRQEQAERAYAAGEDHA